MTTMTLKKKKISLVLHSIMCVMGGFMGGYAIFCRMSNFGNAQTANLIEIITEIVGRDFFDVMLRLIGLGIYVSAIIICVVLRLKTGINLNAYAIMVDGAGLILLPLIPTHINPIIGILPIFFMMSTQWSIFHGVGRFNSSTIFSTNNIKQCTTSFAEYLITKDKHMLRKGKFYGNTLFWFHIGVAIGAVLSSIFGTYASWFGFPIPLVAFFVNVYADKIDHVTHLEQHTF